VKKISLLLITCFFCLPFFVYAYDDSVENDPVEEEPALRELRGPDMIFEIGLNAEFGFANNVITIDRFFKKTLILNLDEFADGLTGNLGFEVSPVYFKYDSKKGWGLGLFTGFDVLGIFDLSGDMLSLRMIEYDKSYLSGAVFRFAGIDTFFHIQKFKVKFRPVMYYALTYIKSDISYTYNNTDQETQFFIDLGLQIFTPYPPDSSKLTALPGVDFSVAIEYPLSKETGISEKFQILDFDVGIDFVNVPIVFSTMKNYVKMNAVLGSKEPVSAENLISSFGTGETSSVYGESDEKVYRPFKAFFWADWRLFPGNILLSIIPTVGFSVSQFYIEPVALEAGLKVRFGFVNRHIFFTLGTGYYDRLWKNSLDIALNFRRIGFNIGADLRAREFAKSWSTGFGLKAGFRFNW